MKHAFLLILAACLCSCQHVTPEQQARLFNLGLTVIEQRVLSQK